VQEQSMPTTTLTSREFHQNSARVKRAAQDGPVIITDRGKPTLVVQRFEDYSPAPEVTEKNFVSLADALYMPGAEDIELELPERQPYVFREIDFD
jgi:prevent-host-death family protein